MRSLPLVLLLAGALGFSGAFLVACGDRNRLIPSDDASGLKSDLDSVASAVDKQDCNGVGDAVSQARERIQSLPARVDSALRQNLLEGIGNVETRAKVDCTLTKSDKAKSTESTTSTAPTATTQPTTTTTQPTTTTTTPTTNTTATTNTTPTTPTTPPDTGGGTPPGQIKNNKGGD